VNRLKKRILAISLLLTIVSNVYAEPYEIKLNKFDSISNFAPFDVIIRVSDKTYAEIDLKEGAKSYLKISVKDNRLIINSRKEDWWKFWKKISMRGTINIYTQNFNFQSIENFGTGSLNFSEIINTNSLKVKLIGTGSINFNGGGEVLNADVALSGTGKVDMKTVNTNLADVALSGTGSIILNANEELNAKISGTGNVIYKGRPKITTKISGTGRLKAI
tara:strand:+ start:3904 stop:4560 length:657 start_codon:yes stop_codon:yes gene_type:complete